MLKKSFLSVFIFGFGLLSLNAQSNGDQVRYEKKAKDILAQASSKIKSYTSIKIDFTYEMENKEQKINESMQGSLISKGEKFNMEIGGQRFISDGTTLWTYMKEMNEVQINLVANSEEDLNPTALISSFETDYRCKWIKNESYQGKQLDIIDMVPNESKAFFKIRIAVDSQSKQLVYSTAYDRNGGTYTYRIKKFLSNVAVNEADFSFDPKKHAGIEIIDLR